MSDADDDFMCDDDEDYDLVLVLNLFEFIIKTKHFNFKLIST